MYIAYKLSDSSRAEILYRITPKFSKVICHHVTYEFPARTLDLPSTPKTAEVVGYALDWDGIEALVVEIDGETKRPDGKIFHVTLSLNPEKKKPVHSNALLESGFMDLTHFLIELKPMFFDTANTVKQITN